jgi:ATP-binding cassette subfamily B protein
MHKGEVQEYGSHEALMQIEDGRYKQLYEMQFLVAGPSMVATGA